MAWTGTAYFHYKDEIKLQKACATRLTSHKFLFLDPTKFTDTGEPGYEFWQLLETAESVSIYTVASERDDWIKLKFDELCHAVLQDCHPLVAPRSADELDMKSVRLQIVRGEVEGHSSFSKINIGRAAVDRASPSWAVLASL
jgi:hypothetical protein